MYNICFYVGTGMLENRRKGNTLAVEQEYFSLDVRVKTGASSEGITGRIGRRYKISVHAAPEKGKANKRLRVLLGEIFDVPVSSVSIISGRTSRDKRVGIAGVSSEACKHRLNSVLSSRSKG